MIQRGVAVRGNGRQILQWEEFVVIQKGGGVSQREWAANSSRWEYVVLEKGVAGKVFKGGSTL